MSRKRFVTPAFLVYGFCFVLLLSGCERSNDDDLLLSPTETVLNLIAPSGEEIAKDVYSLKNEVADFISERYGVDKNFEISSLSYLPVPTGYCVVIVYKTLDGITGNLAISNYRNVEYSSAEIVGKIRGMNHGVKTRGENDGESEGGIKYSCKLDPESKMECTCKLTVYYNHDTGVTKYECDGDKTDCPCVLEFSK